MAFSDSDRLLCDYDLDIEDGFSKDVGQTRPESHCVSS